MQLLHVLQPLDRATVAQLLQLLQLLQSQLAVFYDHCNPQKATNSQKTATSFANLLAENYKLPSQNPNFVPCTTILFASRRWSIARSNR